MSSSQKCDVLEPILMVVKTPHELPAFELRSFCLKGENLTCLLVTEGSQPQEQSCPVLLSTYKGKANIEMSSIIQVLLGSCVVQSLFTWIVMKMEEISLSHELLEWCCQTGKSCNVIIALIMQLMLTDIFTFYSLCKDTSCNYFPGYFLS